MILRTTYIPMRSKRDGFEINTAFFKKRLTLISLGVTYLFGMLIGRSFAGTLGASDQTAAKLIMGFFQNRASQSMWQNFLSSFLSAEACLIILFICGFCAIGAPLVYVVIFFRGLGPGLSLALVFAKTGWNGITAALIMLPAVVGTAIIIILAGKISLKMSLQLFNDSKNRERQAINDISPRFCAQYLVFTVMLSIIALVDGLLFYLFGAVLLG